MLVLACATSTLGSAAHANAASTASSGQPTASSSAVAGADTTRVDALQREVDSLNADYNRIMIPITILVGILATGGLLGIVFSIRDQRRVSQLHGLAVSGEMSAQRRSDQTYTSFLEASQTTLRLVNDTLELAREATERSTKDVEARTAANLNRIEDHARRLLVPILERGEFEAVVVDAGKRGQLEGVARELDSLEGHLALQDMELQPYSRFIKGMAQYLNDDTDAALWTLRSAAEDESIRDLRRFALYWVGRLNSNAGRYSEARQQFTSAKDDLPAGVIQRDELERMIVEVTFFGLAPTLITSRARKRFEAVRELLIKLESIAQDVYAAEAHHRKTLTSHEIAATRGDILTWIAYDVERLNEQLDARARERAAIAASRVRSRQEVAASAGGADESRDDLVTVADAEAVQEWRELDDDELSAWALLQARAYYTSQESGGEDLAIQFGLAECDFKLGRELGDQDARAGTTLPHERVEHLAHNELRSHREQRRQVEVAQVQLVCRVRILKLFRDAYGEEGEVHVRNEKSEVTGAHREVQTDLGELDHKITIFSPLERRNLSRKEFEAEIELVMRKAGVRDGLT